MSELGIKKLAEVEAFLIIGSEILKRADGNFSIEQSEVHATLLQISRLSFKNGVSTENANLFNDKVDKTSSKLRQMMELYIGDSWDNPTEILEWSSFYAGAGAAHCSIAKKLSGKKVDEVALENLQKRFNSLLERIINQLSL